MKRIHEVERMAPVRRRRFLKMLSAALAAPLVPKGLRFAANELAGGVAYAAEHEKNAPHYLVEINLRDQWDHGHLMVAPGLATNGNLQRGASGDKAALYYASGELVHETVNGTDVYLTAESTVLQPHLDHIAMIDTCELNEGAIHGHEAANPVRSPGRSYTQSPGKMAMYNPNRDPVTNFPQGCENFYSSTPTPATLVNHQQRQIDPSMRPGVAFKGISRSIHTAYHFAGSLGAASELERHSSRSTLFAQFPATVEDYNILPDRDEAEALSAVLGKLDARALDRRNRSDATQTAHGQILAEAPDHLYLGEPRVIQLPLTSAEEASWSAGVPDQVGATIRAQIWEQMAWATKLITNDMVRAVALEFDHLDVHGPRDETILRREAAQVALPLARMIAAFKAAGIWQQTTIAIYTTDGSRSVAAESYGVSGKNTVIVAGGAIRGGYYGDIQAVSTLPENGHVYRYHAPDPTTGAPGPGSTDASGRLAASSVWRTVARAAGVPDSLCDQFPDVAGVAPLPFLLR